jgi:hypothetical protein
MDIGIVLFGIDYKILAVQSGVTTLATPFNSTP